jgi:hypothetical protein
VLDSGCTQRMIGDSRIFNSINTNESNVVDSITLVTMAKARPKVLVRLQYLMT